MSKPYYTALDALYMMERHGMTLEPIGEDRKPVTADLLAQHLTFGVQRKFYPDAAGFALLEPRVGDYAYTKRNGSLFQVIKNNFHRIPDLMNVGASVRLCETKTERFIIAFRNNTPFIMPSEE